MVDRAQLQDSIGLMGSTRRARVSFPKGSYHSQPPAPHFQVRVLCKGAAVSINKINGPPRNHGAVP